MVLTVAFQGVPGAFSHDAALALVPGAEPIAFPSFEAVFAALEGGEVERAVVPVENLIAGPVPQVAARLGSLGLDTGPLRRSAAPRATSPASGGGLGKDERQLVRPPPLAGEEPPQAAEGACDPPPLRVVGDAWRPIEMALMALPGVALAELRTVISHPMALKQCGRSLAARGLEPREAFDTAGAAGIVATTGDRTLGALASAAAARLHGLAVLEPNMEDERGNRTRFLVLERAPA